MLRHMGQVTVERDAFRDDTKSLYNTQIAQATTSGIKEQAWRGKCKRLDDCLKECMQQNAALVEQLAAKDRLAKTLAEDRDKLKKNVSRLIAKKGNLQSSTKICKNCQVEFVEKENFNWSCRTHQSEWGGEMWWCCGKRGKDQPGCKFQKHIARSEHEDSEDLGTDGNVMRKQQCKCCKEMGHSIENCSRDPNLITKNDADEDLKRLNKIKDFKKLHADSVVPTTHFIKKSVMVPDEDLAPCNPFNRGIMQFDDYNYNQFNEHVLI